MWKTFLTLLVFLIYAGAVGTVPATDTVGTEVPKLAIQVISQRTTPAQMQDQMRQIIITQAKTLGMPHLLLVETCSKESSLRYNARGLDAAAQKKPRWRRRLSDYSYGLCQLKLGTARWVWSRLVPPDERRDDIEVWHLNDPAFNAKTAAIFLIWLNKRFGDWRPALAAYNEGPYHCVKTDGRNRCRLKKRSQLSLGKGTYEMTIWMRWQSAKLKAHFSLNESTILPIVYLTRVRMGIQ